MKLKNYLSTLIMAIATIHLSEVSAQQTPTTKRSGPSINAGNSNGIKLTTTIDMNKQTLPESNILQNQQETLLDVTTTPQNNVDTANSTAITEPSIQRTAASAVSDQQALPPIPTEISDTSPIDLQPKQPQTDQEQQINQDEIEKAITSTTDDQYSTPGDQDTILETLKILENHDTATRQLLTNDWINQLFNNFVYFKNFIVTNFQKDKILQLCTEFINQIYPKEHVTTLKSSQPQPELDNNNQQTQGHEQNEYIMQSFAQDNNQFQENTFTQQAADATNNQDFNNQTIMQQAPIEQGQEQFPEFVQQEAPTSQELSPEFYQEMNNQGESEEHQEFNEQAIENQQF